MQALIVYDGHTAPAIVNIPDGEEGFRVLKAVSESTCFFYVLSLRSLIDEISDRVICHLECRSYTEKTPGQRVAEALAVGAREREISTLR